MDFYEGKIMAHAGFPNGIGETAICIAEKISKDEDTLRTIHQKNKHNGGEDIS